MDRRRFIEVAGVALVTPFLKANAATANHTNPEQQFSDFLKTNLQPGSRVEVVRGAFRVQSQTPRERYPFETLTPDNQLYHCGASNGCPDLDTIAEMVYNPGLLRNPSDNTSFFYYSSEVFERFVVVRANFSNASRLDGSPESWFDGRNPRVDAIQEVVVHPDTSVTDPILRSSAVFAYVNSTQQAIMLGVRT